MDSDELILSRQDRSEVVWKLFVVCLISCGACVVSWAVTVMAVVCYSAVRTVTGSSSKRTMAANGGMFDGCLTEGVGGDGEEKGSGL